MSGRAGRGETKKLGRERGLFRPTKPDIPSMVLVIGTDMEQRSTTVDKDKMDIRRFKTTKLLFGSIFAAARHSERR